MFSSPTRRAFFLGIFAGLATGYLLFTKSPRLPHELDEFLAFVQANQISAAYALTAGAFQKSVSEDVFQRLPLIKVIRSATKQDVISIRYAHRASVVEMIFGTPGKITPVRFTLKKENDSWRLYSLYLSTAGSSRATAELLPKGEELQTLVDRFLELVSSAVQANNYSQLYSALSETWRAQATQEELANALSELSGRKSDLKLIETGVPVITSIPIVDEQGTVQLRGHYSDKAGQLYFTIRLIYEPPEWKPLGVWVK